MLITNIVWETDGELVNLPTEVNIPDGISGEDIGDWLSDKYGFLIISYTN